LVPERDGIQDTALESYLAIAVVVSTGKHSEMCHFGLYEFLENSGYFSYIGIPIFYFSVKPKWGDRRVGASRKWGAMPPKPPLAPPLTQEKCKRANKVLYLPFYQNEFYVQTIQLQ